MAFFLGVARSVHLPPLPSLREIIRIYGIRAQKQLSQNFLLQPTSINGLIKCTGNLRGAYVLEVGPGPGGITRAILQKNPRYVAVVELDRRFIPGLQELRLAALEMGIQMDIYRQDILKFNCEGIFPISSMTGEGAWNHSPELRNSSFLKSTMTHQNDSAVENISSPRMFVIGNLPFNISTPLISRWLHDIAERRGIWRYGRVSLTLTFQKEVAERLAADVWDEQRSRLSIMSQAYCDVKYMKDIPGTAFVPPPKVDVGVVRLTPLKEPLIPVPYPYVEKLVRQAFHFRQKQIIRCLETLFPSDRPELVIQLFKEAGVQPVKQCIQLTMSEFRDLCFVYHRICQTEPDIFDFDYQRRVNLPLWRNRKKIQREILGGSTCLTANHVRQEIYGSSP
ncbi:hypothetical protein MN116_005352 [Schistosoma mekongi]|uniref:rRNA adenine N(6)-methyltransferase n=1 Tax=Schistosoma mekongi TaxID=38744 RepID=A0AAE1ZEI9_SCHME|nr:hypothetical protein MN116_005352 [Schistosoma mekongi]